FSTRWSRRVRPRISGWTTGSSPSTRSTLRERPGAGGASQGRLPLRTTGGVPVQFPPFGTTDAGVWMAVAREAEPVGSLTEVREAGLDREDLLGIYRNMLITRGVEERGHILYRQGKIPGSFYTGRG